MAKLPNVEAAIVGADKLSDYLLNLSHPRGAAKALFLIAFDFATDHPDDVRSALIDHAKSNDVSSSHKHEFGSAFEIDGRLQTPDGRNTAVRTVWQLDAETDAPRLITPVPRDHRLTRGSA